MDMFDLKHHCRMFNCDCACLTTAVLCPLLDENYECLLKKEPADWDIDKIKQAFEKLKDFNYGIKQFDYI